MGLMARGLTEVETLIYRRGIAVGSQNAQSDIEYLHQVMAVALDDLKRGDTSSAISVLQWQLDARMQDH